MKILITGATAEEIKELQSIKNKKHSIDFEVTGIGMLETCYNLTKILSDEKYDVAINCGIAGSFDRSIEIGETVFVNQDFISELGAENHEDFLTISEMGLNAMDSFISKVNEQFPVLNSFRSVKAITVNTVHGNENSISKIIERLHPEIETMEGAAFYYVCEKENIPSVQLRAISNYVEKRNREAWNIPLALRSLYEAISKTLNEI